MNPDGRSLRSSKIMRMAINRINPNFDRDLRNMSKIMGQILIDKKRLEK